MKDKAYRIWLLITDSLHNFAEWSIENKKREMKVSIVASLIASLITNLIIIGILR